ncbi:MAG: transposase [Gammaproteobacteria bacterium]|nr:transposase [Gammaproteobacteria bacterium]
MCGKCPQCGPYIRKPEVSVYRQVTFFGGSKAKDTHPQTTAMKVRIDSREGWGRYSRWLGNVEPMFGNLHTHGLHRFTLRSRRKVDA